jgi:hypothetical protein
MQNNFLEKFEQYVNDWNELDKFRLNWWLKYPFYIPIGFYLEMKNLNKKSRLTKNYSNYLNTLSP